MFFFGKGLVHHPLEAASRGSVAEHVEEAADLAVLAELRPGEASKRPYREPLPPVRAIKPSEGSDIRALRSCVEGGYDARFREADVAYFALEKRLGHHPDHFPDPSSAASATDAHQADGPAAVDEGGVIPGGRPVGSAAGLRLGRDRACAGAAKNTGAVHPARTSGPRRSRPT